MTVDPAWEAAHAARAWGRWPHQAAVEFVGRHHKMDGTGLTALDIGCGAGACTWMLARSGFLVHAVDGSASAVDRANDWLDAERLSHRATVTQYEAVAMQWPDRFFDCVLDVCCLACVPEDEARKVIERVHGWLNPCGRFLMVAAADDCDPAIHGEFKVRQATRADIDMLFGAFSDVFVGKHTRLTRRGFISEWVVEAQK